MVKKEENVINEKIEGSPSENKAKETISSQNSKTLVNVDLYLKYGIHIGTKYKSGAMRKFIFKSRNDKLNVMDVQIIDKRIKVAIDFLLRYKPEEVMFVSRKRYALPGLKLLERNFGYGVKLDRFIPGTFTNPLSKHFIEPRIVFIVDPNIDRQAIVESKKIRIPIVALSTTSSNVRDIDLIVPFNNKGRKSVALFFWIFYREVLLKNGVIKSEEEYTYKVDDFVYALDDRKDESPQKTMSRFGKKVVPGRRSFGDRPRFGREGSSGSGDSFRPQRERRPF